MGLASLTMTGGCSAGRGQLADVALRADREDGRAHADGQLAGQRRRQHQRPRAVGRQAGQLVDRAHRQLARRDPPPASPAVAGSHELTSSAR